MPPADTAAAAPQLVYAFRNPTDGFIKIGSTNDVELRLKSGRTWVPNLELVATGGGGSRRERALHRMLEDHRVPGTEWFAPTPEVLEAVETIAEEPAAVIADTDEADSDDPTSSLGQLLRRLRGERPQREIARAVGVSPAAVWHWENGRSHPAPKHWAALSRTLDVPAWTIWTAVDRDLGDAA